MLQTCFTNNKEREQSLTNSWKHWRGRGSPAFLNPRDWPSCKKMDLNPVSVIWISLHLFCASCYTLFECCQQREITIQAVSKWSWLVQKCASVFINFAQYFAHCPRNLKRNQRDITAQSVSKWTWTLQSGLVCINFAPHQEIQEITVQSYFIVILWHGL